MSITYDVFARKEYAEPLVYIGPVEVDNAGEVAQTSLEKYGPESEWLEMIAVSHDQVFLVFSDKGSTVNE